MQYKSKKNLKLNKAKINNEIKTVNLKIKNIHILLDDISTKNRNDNYNFKNQKFLSMNNTNSNIIYFPSINSHKLYFSKRNTNSLKSSNKSLRAIPINIKKSFFSTNNTSSLPSLSNTYDNNNNYYNSSNLASIISRKNELSSNKNSEIKDYIKKKNKRKKGFYDNSINYSFDHNSNKENSFIKRFHRELIKSQKRNTYSRKASNKSVYCKNVKISKNIKPFLLSSGAPRNSGNKNTLMIENFVISKKDVINSDSEYINNYNSRNIKNRKINFYFKNDTNSNEKKSSNTTTNNNFLRLKSILIIQKWWKNIKKIKVLKFFVVLIQKIFRGYNYRKKNFFLKYKNNNLIKKIPKYNNIYKYYFISKCYYKNNLPNIILLQRKIRKFIMQIKIYNQYHINKKNNYEIAFLNQKPKNKICYITKYLNKTKTKRISFINKKIKCIANKKNYKIMKIDLENNKILFSNKSLNDSSNSFISNITKNIYLHNNITIQTIDSKESQDICQFSLYNKNQINNINKISKSFYYFQNLFKNNIIHKLYLSLLKMKYRYMNLSYFIKAIYKVIVKYKKRIFLANLSVNINVSNIYNCYSNLNSNFERKINFINVIIRHINIYKKNNNNKNEVIQLIEKNLPKNLNINQINLENKKLLLNISDEQEENLINSQIFKDDDINLINYICLFFKYDKNKKYLNYNFVQNRLIKDPLKYRNIFTITRYIDNLEDQINNKKICKKCFCKKNEKKCKLNCNCHYIQDIINRNCIDNFVPKFKSRKSSLKKSIINEYNNNKENNNIINFAISIKKDKLERKNEENNNDEYQDNENINTNNISKDNLIKKINIHKAFTYFSK